MRNWKREFDFLGGGLVPLGVCAFLFAVGGALLWVCGGSGWYVLKAAGREAPSVGGLFALSLAVCGLCGLLGGLTAMAGYRLRPAGAVLPPLGLTAASYLFHLGWYAVFCCTRLMLFGGILAALSLLAAVLSGLFSRGTLRLILLTAVLLALAEAAVLSATFSLIL